MGIRRSWACLACLDGRPIRSPVCGKASRTFADGVGKRLDSCRLAQHRNRLTAQARTSANRARRAWDAPFGHVRRHARAELPWRRPAQAADAERQERRPLGAASGWCGCTRRCWRKLEAAGTTGGRSIPPCSAAVSTTISARIKAILAEEYGDADLVVIKDPRMCRFMPLYKDALAELGITPRFVLMHRNPLAVMASLRKRNGMTPGFAGLLWLRHVLDAFAATARPPPLLPVLRDLSRRLARARRGGPPPSSRSPGRGTQSEAAKGVDGYLVADLQHHAPSLAELDRDQAGQRLDQGGLPGAVAASSRASNAEAIDTLDRIKAEFERQSAIFGDATLARACRARTKPQRGNRQGGGVGKPARRRPGACGSQIKQAIKDVYESLPLPPLKKASAASRRRRRTSRRHCRASRANRGRSSHAPP